MIDSNDILWSGSNPNMVNRILIAADNTALSGVLRFNLARAGFDVEIVGDGEHALSTCHSAESAFDLIVSDHHMPRRNGIDFCRELRATDTRYATIPVILLTAKQLELDVDQLTRDGEFAAVFAKPFSPFQIVENVKTLLLQVH